MPFDEFIEWIDVKLVARQLKIKSQIWNHEPNVKLKGWGVNKILWTLELSIYVKYIDMLFPILFFLVLFNSDIFVFVFIWWLMVSSLSHYELCFTIIYLFIFWLPRFLIIRDISLPILKNGYCWFIFLRKTKQWKLIVHSMNSQNDFRGKENMFFSELHACTCLKVFCFYL